MHHSSVALSNGTIILIAGRQSPYFMCDQMLKVTLHTTDDCGVSFQSQHSTSLFSSAECNISKEKFSLSKDSEKVLVTHAGNMDTEECVQLSSSSSTSNDVQSNKSADVKAAAPVSNSEFDGALQEHDKDRISSQSFEGHSLSQTLNFKLGSVKIEVVEQKGIVPRERWRHASVVVMHDGKFFFSTCDKFY